MIPLTNHDSSEVAVRSSKYAQIYYCCNLMTMETPI